MVKLPNDYFPHDFNSRTDRKILRLRQVLGVEGYGIYWMLIETLATEEDFSYPMKDIDLLADDFGTSKEKVEAVVKQFDLFKIDKHAMFFSLSLIARMQKYIELSENARKAVNIRWENARKLKEMDTPVLLPHNEGNTIKEKNIKEHKIKRIKPVDYFENLYNLYLLDFVNKLPLETWKEWVNYRREIKKKLTKSIADKQLKFLLLQDSPTACINESIKNGWAGLFELKGKPKEPVKSSTLGQGDQEYKKVIEEANKQPKWRPK